MSDLYICRKIHRSYEAIRPYVPAPVVRDVTMDNLHTLHIPYSGRDMVCGAEYVGPLSLWKGKTAMLSNLVAIQMDDRGQYMSHGWHLFNASEWKVPSMGPLYAVLTKAIEARRNCLEKGNDVWLEKWSDFIKELMDDHLPSGSGFDAGTSLDLDACNDTKLVFITSFHHMDNGSYSGWTEHQVVVTPSLSSGFSIRVTGPNRNDIKDYIGQVFHEILSKKVNEWTA